nr:penicillin-binding protein 1C [Tatlockia sp.]
MRLFFKLSSFLVLTLIVSAISLYLAPKPPLLSGLSFSTAVYDDQQHLLRLTLSQDDKYRLFTPLSKISPQLKEATLLQEDHYFYWHLGLNPLAMFKAGWQTYLIKTRRMGASTITMQLARIRYGINSKKLSGKLEQIIRALQLELHYSKDQILEAYLNLAPYGSNIEGVGAASLVYFAKPINKINLPEALTLTVIPQNPSQRTPSNRNLKDIRDKLFLRWLLHHPEDKNTKASINLPLEMHTRHTLPFIAPHFVNSLIKNAKEQQEIKSTLDARLQAILKRISANYLLRKKGLGVHNVAVLLVDSRNMSVKGLIGSADFFNRAIGGQIDGSEIKRSPGSTLKPFIYGLALDQGLIHPNTVLKDVPHSFGSYNPENFDYDFMGPIKAKDALVLSRNIPAIYLASQLTKPNLHQLLEKAEIRLLKPESYYGLALNLGALELTLKELTSLYAILANDGLWYPLRSLKDE